MAIKSRGGAVALGCTGTDRILSCHLQSLASPLSPHLCGSQPGWELHLQTGAPAAC